MVTRHPSEIKKWPPASPKNDQVRLASARWPIDWWAVVIDSHSRFIGRTITSMTRPVSDPWNDNQKKKKKKKRRKGRRHHRHQTSLESKENPKKRERERERERNENRVRESAAARGAWRGEAALPWRRGSPAYRLAYPGTHPARRGLAARLDRASDAPAHVHVDVLQFLQQFQFVDMKQPKWA